MTALSASRMISQERWTRRRFTLSSGEVAYKGGIAAIDLSTGEVVVGFADPGLFVVGLFAEDKDASAAASTVDVDLGKEIVISWCVNGSSITAADIGSLCYVDDDQTVHTTSTGRSVAGRIWAVETTRGVAVERLQAVPSAIANLSGLPLDELVPGAFAANDLVIASNPASGSVIDIPATGAASTVTLPATAEGGTMLVFRADGALNAHTVQYRDATGPVNLTTALTASKRHQVTAVHLGGKWTASAYVSP